MEQKQPYAYLCDNRKCLKTYTIDQAEQAGFICLLCKSHLAGVHCGPKEEDGQHLQEIIAQELQTKYLPKT
jgi:transcription initiation factor IIE alpha subunit